MNSIEICFSPALYKYKTTTDNFIVVIIDVLRATTAFCAAFDSGARAVIPVSGLEELLVYKNKGYLTAAERDGNKVDFADFGNSPTVFLDNDLNGKELAYSTTNGTQAVEMAKSSGNIAAAAFVNLSTVSEWLNGQQKNVIILCSGWKNTFSLEDTLCAGALVEILEQTGLFYPICDASGAALSLWQSSKNNLQEVVKKANHYQRLIKLGQQVDLMHCFRLNTSEVVPVWNGIGFVDQTKKSNR
jgi:2-phosphosulfolactate phosphatase